LLLPLTLSASWQRHHCGWKKSERESFSVNKSKKAFNLIDQDRKKTFITQVLALSFTHDETTKKKLRRAERNKNAQQIYL
jgi:hypothetical protein